LVRERLPIHQDESGDLMHGDDRTRHHGFACSGRRDQHPQIVPGQDLDSCLLWSGQHGRAGECLRSAGRTLISQVKLAACLPACLPACAASSVTVVSMSRGTIRPPSMVSSKNCAPGPVLA
jgi:hypothetical protein